jgi:serpin B
LGPEELHLRSSFLKLTQDSYGAALQEVDFSGANEQARQDINAWVEEQTQQKIKELIKPGVLSKNMRLVLTNAIYFKAAWASQFSPRATKPGDFKVAPNNRIADVPMMHKLFTGNVKYHDGDDMQILGLPYVKNELTMFVLLPKTVNGLAVMEKALADQPGHLADLLARAQPGRVDVTLPKFKVTASFRLDEQLQALGMETAFKFGKADFSGIATREPLFIGAVVHKAFVDVNEEGTEAAAATAVGAAGGGKQKEPPVFRADHPFLFLIVDNYSGSILFIGRLTNPKG